MRLSAFKVILLFFYALGLAAIAWAAWYGWDYYNLPLIERPHSEFHKALKPGGLIGHGFGIVGSAMILMLFLYSMRKRGWFWLRFGKMNRWLDIHIWFGIMGPLLITLHTAGKFHGIVSISYFSMVAVMLSGFFGRYIYMQIPRDESGHALSLADLDDKIEHMSTELSSELGIPKEELSEISKRAGRGIPENRRGLGVLIVLFWLDLTRSIRHRRLRRELKRRFPKMHPTNATTLFILARRRTLLMRKRAMLRSTNELFHYWHVVHKPFAIVMVLIMVVHVTVVVLMGYRWVF